MPGGEPFTGRERVAGANDLVGRLAGATRAGVLRAMGSLQQKRVNVLAGPSYIKKH
jgi:hypothetical protein